MTTAALGDNPLNISICKKNDVKDLLLISKKPYHNENNGQISKQNTYPSMNVSNKYMSKNLPSLKNFDIGLVIKNAIPNINTKL